MNEGLSLNVESTLLGRGVEIGQSASECWLTTFVQASTDPGFPWRMVCSEGTKGEGGRRVGSRDGFGA
jgi:hypothetical protein